MGGRCGNCAGEINEGVGEEAGTNREENRSTQETVLQNETGNTKNKPDEIINTKSESESES